MSIANKLTYLNETKGLIKESINLTGANITNEPFRDYAVMLTNQLPELIGNPSPIWSNYEHVSGTGTSFSINAYNSIFDYDIKGDTAQNGTPTPSTPVPVNVVSGDNEIEISDNSYPIYLGVENLFDIATATAGSGLTKNGNVFTSNSLSSYNGILINLGTNINVKNGENYYISYDVKVNSGDTKNLNYFGRLNDGTNYTSFGSLIGTFTISNEYQRVVWLTSATSDFIANKITAQANGSITNPQIIEIKNIQVAKTNNNYTPYGTTPIELCKIGTYQDYIYKNNGSWYLHKEIGKVVLNGDEEWGNGSTGSYSRFLLSLTNANTSSSRSICKTNYFNYMDTGHVEGGCFIYGGSIYLYPDININTDEEWKQWLENNNTILYYPLATATDTEITDYQLIYQLDQVKLVNGTNNVITSGNDLSPIISIEAIKYLK